MTPKKVAAKKNKTAKPKANQNLQHALEAKVARYETLTKKGLEKISILARKGTKEYAVAMDYVSMAQNYFNDAKHFRAQGELLIALAAFSYAHAWLDAGVRAGLFDGKNDDQLFTLP
ncbi:MAG: DUF357 domain-containing protein [Candidatus Iainarchaeum archaeon]|uniref:DUF357 domain-containing protein n=1 Tax=Candidatus Iainarchaeum sp. TaxID=3101447 RepID=A0A7T9I1F3_9ARCH|nr:MAG: DUF357 domain-containing protein [Candidatus Diapherotrites archaeon]